MAKNLIEGIKAFQNAMSEAASEYENGFLTYYDYAKFAVEEYDKHITPEIDPGNEDDTTLADTILENAMNFEFGE